MCGRYSLHANPEVIALAFKLGLMPDITARYNIAPSARILMKNIHDRMPVILRPEDYSAWLDPGNQATAELKQLLKPYPAAAMTAHRVSPRVNTAKYDDSALIEPFESVTEGK